jgi:hypothetical protein
MPRKQVFCGQCHDVSFFIRSLADVGCLMDPLEITWNARFLTCHSLLLMWKLHYVAMCVFANVVCDTKMSHETSCSMEAFIFGYFWGDALFSWTAFVTVGSSM